MPTGNFCLKHGLVCDSMADPSMPDVDKARDAIAEEIVQNTNNKQVVQLYTYMYVYTCTCVYICCTCFANPAEIITTTKAGCLDHV